MPATPPVSSREAIQAVAAGAPHYFKGHSDLTFRRRLWLAFLKQYGQVLYNAEGWGSVWDIEYSQPEFRPYGDGSDQEFTNHNAFLQMNTDVRGYTVTDLLTRKQYLMTKGKVKITDLYEGKSQRILKSLGDNLCEELYTDGSLAGNEDRLIGSDTLKQPDTIAATDMVSVPTAGSEYAGQGIAIADHGGTWSADLAAADRPCGTLLSTDWPYGSGSTEYDCLTPLYCNYESTVWANGTSTWKDNCEDVLSFMNTVMSNKGGDDNAPQINLLDSRLFHEFKRHQAQFKRIVMPHKEASDLGFGRALDFEGSVVHSEFGARSGEGVCFNPMHVELFSLNDDLFKPDGPAWSMDRKAFLYEGEFFGNMRWQPKFLGFVLPLNP